MSNLVIKSLSRHKDEKKMCYSAESSMTAWALANFIALILFCRNSNYDRWNAGFIIVFSTVQLLEAGIWQGVSNELLTRLILIVLMLEPLAQCWLGAIYTGSSLLYYLTLLFVIVFLYTWIVRVVPAKPGQYSTIVGPNGHLVWRDRKGTSSGLMGSLAPLWLVGMVLPLFFAKGRGVPLIAVGLGSFLYSMTHASADEVGSMWCYYAVLYAVVALFV